MVLLKGHEDSRTGNSDRAEIFGACRGFGRDLRGGGWHRYLYNSCPRKYNKSVLREQRDGDPDHQVSGRQSPDDEI